MTERFAFLGVKRFRTLLALYSSLGLYPNPIALVCMDSTSVMWAVTFLYGQTDLIKKEVISSILADY